MVRVSLIISLDTLGNLDEEEEQISMVSIFDPGVNLE